jgi:hypothetical protein
LLLCVNSNLHSFERDRGIVQLAVCEQSEQLQPVNPDRVKRGGKPSACMSGRRELDPLSSPWEGDILPVNYARKNIFKLYITEDQRGIIKTIPASILSGVAKLLAIIIRVQAYRSP